MSLLHGDEIHARLNVNNKITTNFVHKDDFITILKKTVLQQFCMKTENDENICLPSILKLCKERLTIRMNNYQSNRP